MKPSSAREDRAALKRARNRANHRIAFISHAIAFGMTVMFLLFVAGFTPALVVALSWGIGLAMHWFWCLKAPELRDRWVRDELGPHVQASVVRERKAVGADRAREMHQLSAAVAHEIRNPITAAKSLVQQMGEDPNATENVAYAKVAIEELDRVERSIAQLLRYAREQDVKMAPMRLGDAVRSALGNMEDRLDQVEVSCALGEDDEMHGDNEALRRVIINLLRNACDAIEEEGPAQPLIVIESGRDLAGREIWLRLRDNGKGVDEETAATMFDPFQTSKDEGTGLGLAICRRLVEAHGGRIELTPASELSEGCELVLTFPTQGASA